MSREARYIQPGEVITWVNDTESDVEVGDVVNLGSRIGVALVDIPNEGSGAVKVTGVFELPAIKTAAFSVGDQVYWDSTNGNLTNSSTDNTPAGWVVEAKAAAGATAKIKLLG